MARQRKYTVREYRRDKQLVQEASRLSVENVFVDGDTKRILLSEYGYENLFGPAGRIPLQECSNERVGNAFQNTYYNASYRLNRLTAEQRMTLEAGLSVLCS